jgi:hypothetical protein
MTHDTVGRREPRPLGWSAAAAASQVGYIEPMEGAAAFLARRLAGFFALRAAGFLVDFLATLRFVFRAVFFAVLRAGFLAAALRTVVRFFLADFLFAVIGMKRLPLTFGPARHAPPTNAAKYEDVGLTKQYRRCGRILPVKYKIEKPAILLHFSA